MPENSRWLKQSLRGLVDESPRRSLMSEMCRWSSVRQWDVPGGIEEGRYFFSVARRTRPGPCSSDTRIPDDWVAPLSTVAAWNPRSLSG